MISAQGLTKFYGDKCAIHDLDFQIGEGEIVGFLGLNGAGKTTTLRVLACLLLPSSGTVRIKGFDVVENPHDIRKLVGFLPETPPLYEEMTVEGYLLFAAQLRGLSHAHARDRLEQAIEATNLKDVRHDVISSLSHGYRQRVGIAQAVIHDPPVLILDEPIKGLDPVQIVEVRELVRRLKGKHTILLSSHILSEISQTCDRILMIKSGEIVAAGSEQELTRAFSGANRLHVAVRGQRDAVVGVVRGVEGVTRCESVAVDYRLRVAGTSDIVQLDVATDRDLRQALSRALVEQGHGLLELGPAAAELETVFLQLSQQQVSQQQPSHQGRASKEEG